MTTSRSVSVLRCMLVLWRIRIASIWFETSATEFELAALEQRESAIDHDEHVDAHLARHVDGQVRGKPAVDQHAAVGLHRREHARAPTGWRASP